MRMWHQKLIPKLCRPHLLSVWREGLGMLSIITNGKKGYRNHPATQEFINTPWRLLERLYQVRNEMLKRGYKPKELPPMRSAYLEDQSKINQWQSLSQQILRIKEKGCKCIIN